MKKLLLITILLASTNSFSSDTECFNGIREAYHAKMSKPYLQETYIICHQMEKSHHAAKKGKIKEGNQLKH